MLNRGQNRTARAWVPPLFVDVWCAVIVRQAVQDSKKSKSAGGSGRSGRFHRVVLIFFFIFSVCKTESTSGIRFLSAYFIFWNYRYIRSLRMIFIRRKIPYIWEFDSSLSVRIELILVRFDDRYIR